MFSREESKIIRQQFWIFFGRRHPRKWMMYNTGVKEINLKFSIDTKKAQVSYDIETNDEFYKAYYYDKFLSLKKLMYEEISHDLIFEENYTRSSGKEISRIYLQKDAVNIHNKTHWPEIFEFFNTYMDKLESFWLDYKDFITS